MADDVVSFWLKQAGRHPLLSASQEIFYGNQIQRSLHPDATIAEKRLGKKAHEKMLLCNLRLVVALAKKFSPRISHSGALSIEDLYQCGVLGLSHGLYKFNPTHGYKASTYLYWWARQGITREIIHRNTTIRIPATHTGVMTKLRFKPKDQTVEEFAKEHNYTIKQVERAYDAMHICNPSSLDTQMRKPSDDGSFFSDTVADRSQLTIDDLDHIYAIEQLEQLGDLDDLALIQLQQENVGIKELSGLIGLSMEQGRKEIEAAKIRLQRTVIEHKELVST